MFKRLILYVTITFLCSTSLCFADTSATQAYLEIHKKELAAESYADILPLRSKSSIAKDEPMSDEDKKKIFPLFKATLPVDVTVIGEEIKGNNAFLKVTAAPEADLKPGSKETTTGTIEMNLEDGQWKLDNENWQSHVEIH